MDNVAISVAVMADRWLLLIHQLPAKPAYLRVEGMAAAPGAGSGRRQNAVYVLPANEQTQEGFFLGRPAVKRLTLLNVAFGVNRYRNRTEERTSRDVSKAPTRDSCTAANHAVIRSPRWIGRAAIAALREWKGIDALARSYSNRTSV
jgi:hypothetical protein